MSTTLTITDSIFGTFQEIKLLITKKQGRFKLFRFECREDEVPSFLELLTEEKATLAFVVGKPPEMKLLGNYVIGYWHSEEIEMEIHS